jgi:FKBP-type peptidyl-prolyl cis-trans isomerase
MSKNNNITSLFIISIIALLAISCNSDTKAPSPEQLREPLIGANRKLVSRESQDIDAYIRTRSLQMIRTGTGLRYIIVKEGDGPFPKTDDRVKVNYKVSLLDGTLCYDSEKSGPEEFIVEHDHIESGLHEGIKLMRLNGQAKFILPSHLAHGLLGDRDKIPPLSPVVYDIELIDIK